MKRKKENRKNFKDSSGAPCEEEGKKRAAKKRCAEMAAQAAQAAKEIDKRIAERAKKSGWLHKVEDFDKETGIKFAVKELVGENKEAALNNIVEYEARIEREKEEGRYIVRIKNFILRWFRRIKASFLAKNMNRKD